MDFTFVALAAAATAFNFCKAHYHGGHILEDSHTMYSSDVADHSVSELAGLRLAVLD
ncbi:hypothetical protein [Kutzneria buriramensis]|uniref:hypothetical protein n=1 Tax=Kutzneria buriramensis TaxID=1045776 RepID=UPI001476BCD2|nr:hypothetical protein [Kutzneria buriramensis]